MTTWSGQILQCVNNPQPVSTADLVTAFPSNVTAGNLIVVAVSWYNAASPTYTLTDTLSNTYTLVGSVLHPDGSSGLVMYYCANCNGGANTVTFASATSLYKDMTIIEFPGNSSTTLDTTNGRTGISTTANSGNITPAGANELIIGFGTDVWTTSSSIRVLQYGWTVIPSYYDNPTTMNLYGGVVPSLGTSAVSAQWALPPNGGWAAIVAAFKNMSGGAAGGGLLSQRHFLGGLG